MHTQTQYLEQNLKNHTPSIPLELAFPWARHLFYAWGMIRMISRSYHHMIVVRLPRVSVVCYRVWDHIGETGPFWVSMYHVCIDANLYLLDSLFLEVS